MKKDEKQNLLRPVILAGIIGTLALSGFVGAKYLLNFFSDTGKVTSDKFYFTSDLLGDQRMIATNGEASGNYQFQDVQEGQWHLYGGGKHQISLSIRNFADAKRVTEETITYTAEVTAEDADGNPVADLVTFEREAGNAAAYTLSGGAEQKDMWSLSVKPHEDVPYTDGTKVTVTVQSTSPYKKIMKFQFLLYAVDTYLSYEIKDNVNSPYAELYIMTNIVGKGEGTAEVQPYLVWSENLSIDNTSNLTYTNQNGSFQQMPGIGQRNMQISRKLQAGESEFIYFFKNNPKENYSKEQTLVEWKDNKYTIEIQ